MMYGYACRRVTDPDYVLDRQITELRSYAKSFRVEIKIITEVIDLNVEHEPFFKEKYKKLTTILKPNDKVVFTSLDYVDPTTTGIAASLAYIYYVGATAIVLDFPILPTLKVNRTLEQAGGRLMAYRAMIDPLLQYRLFLRYNGTKGAV